MIDLTVWHFAVPQIFQAKFKPDSENRLRLDGRLKPEEDRPWCFRTGTGTLPNERNTLVIWRKLREDPEQSNLMLDE